MPNLTITIDAPSWDEVDDMLDEALRDLEHAEPDTSRSLVVRGDARALWTMTEDSDGLA